MTRDYALLRTLSMPNETRLEEPKNTVDNISMSQEKTRTWLAKGLFIALTGLIGVVIVFSFFKDASSLALYDTAISGLIGLMGIVLGFYFASKSN